MAYTLLAINTRSSITLDPSKPAETLRALAQAIDVTNTGESPSVDDFLALSSTTAAGADALGRAAAILTLDTVSGTIGATINGTAVTVAATETEATDAAAIVAAINASATVSPIVFATRYLGTLTLVSMVAGQSVTVCGVKFTAQEASTAPGEFTIGGLDDTDSAANLAIAINTQFGLLSKVRAVSVAGVVYVGLLADRAPRSDEVMTASAGTVTVAAFAAGAYLMVAARTPGLVGNAIGFEASGTGVTAASARADYLGGGTGGFVAASGAYMTQVGP